MRFQPGNSGGPGRPKGSTSGRAKALAALDRILGQEENIKKFEKELQDEFERGPIDFFRTFAMPLLPKNVIVESLQSQIELERLYASIDETLSQMSTEDLRKIAYPESATEG